MKISAIVILLTGVVCLADAPNVEKVEAGKAATLRGEANNWIQVGISQYERGLYRQAEESFLAAEDYQEYLTASEKMKLQEHLDKTRQALVERKAVLEHLQNARDLLNQGQPIKARAQYEKVRNSPYLTEQEQKQLAGELKGVDAAFDKRRREITELYNRSVEFYRAGDLEKARDGFAEVIKSGVLVAPKGQMAEDYLVQIDNILLERFKSQSYAVTPQAPAAPSQRPESSPVQPDSNQQPAMRGQPAQTIEEQVREVTAAAETTPEKKTEAAAPEDARAKIIRTYTKAVLDDTEIKVTHFIGSGEFDKALAAVRSAAGVVGENRPFIGDDAFVQYTSRLKQLADRIIQARKKS